MSSGLMIQVTLLTSDQQGPSKSVNYNRTRRYVNLEHREDLVLLSRIHAVGESYGSEVGCTFGN